MKSLSQLQESIERFGSAFWRKEPADRPPMAVADSCTFMPIHYLRRPPFPREEVLPQDVTADLVMTDYQYAAARRRVTRDDLMPFTTPWRAVPWMEAMCGCRVMAGEGSLRPAHFLESLEAVLEMTLPAEPKWLDHMLDLARQQVESAPADCWVSPGVLRGPADVLAAMRGQVEFFTDVVDEPGLVRRAGERVNELLIEVVKKHFEVVPPKLGGYVHSYGYWAPGPTVVIQEDAMGLCSPQTYRQLFAPIDAETVKALGGHVLFHLHSTGMQHWRDVLALPGLPGVAGLELSIEATGPSLETLLPVLRKILERSRLILFAEHYFDQLPGVLRQLPREGLFVIVPDTHIRDDEDFARFVASAWG